MGIICSKHRTPALNCSRLGEKLVFGDMFWPTTITMTFSLDTVAAAVFVSAYFQSLATPDALHSILAHLPARSSFAVISTQHACRSLTSYFLRACSTAPL